MINQDGIRQRWGSIGSKLGERDRWLWAASEVQASGYGALAIVSAITGIARSTINRGGDDLDEGPLPEGRVRRNGGGGGKPSTFARLLAGRLALMGGQMRAAAKMEVGFFAQHQLDDLVPSRTPYAYMTVLLPDATEAQRRTRLGTYGFSFDKADTRCEHLSGGEKARLLMMLTTFAGPHLLILDEPTNHLDVDSREALIHALNDYDGAVILISHDRHLIEASADLASAEDAWLAATEAYEAAEAMGP